MIEGQRRSNLDPEERNPDAVLWQEVPVHDLPLVPVPTRTVDTSQYVRDGVSRARVGAVDEVRVQCVLDDQRISFRLQWWDSTRDDEVNDSTDFADKAGIMFPLAEGASVMSMGSPAAPVNIWFWRADRDRPRDVLAKGMGTTDRRDPDRSGLESFAHYGNDRWTVVLTRPRTGREPDCVELSDRRSVGVSFAVWDGDNNERGPLKSFSGEFQELLLEEAPDR